MNICCFLKKNSYDSVCQNKTYGTGCSKECGHCLGGKQCNHINGTCDNSCDSGYYKSGCKEGKRKKPIFE